MKIKKSTFGIIIAIALLAAAVGVLAALNAKDARERASVRNDGVFVITSGGQSYTVDYDTLLGAGIKSFTANYGKPAVKKTYHGVPLKTLCNALGIDLSEAKSCVARAADGFSTAVSVDKINDTENVYIAITLDGDGPYRLIVVKDAFNQNWCKLLVELTFK